MMMMMVIKLKGAFPQPAVVCQAFLEIFASCVQLFPFNYSNMASALALTNHPLRPSVRLKAEITCGNTWSAHSGWGSTRSHSQLNQAENCSDASEY